MNISSQTDKLHNSTNSNDSFLQKKRESPNDDNKEIEDNNMRGKKIKESEKAKNNENDLLDKIKDESKKNNNSNNDKKQNSSDTEIIELNSNTENKNEEKKVQDSNKINPTNNQENENKENEPKKENINVEKNNNIMTNEKNINELMNNNNNNNNINKEEDNLDNNSVSKQLSISIKSIEKLSKNDKVKNLFTSNGLNYEKNIIFKANIGYEFDITVCGIRIQMGPFISDRKARSVIRFINQSKHIISAISIGAKREWFKNLSQMLEELLE